MNGHLFRYAFPRKDYPIQLRNFHKFRKFIEKIPDKGISHWESYKPDGPLFIEGSPVFSHFRISPSSEYISDYTQIGVYQDYPVDPDILSKFPFDASKYIQPETSINETGFRLYPMQYTDREHLELFHGMCRAAKRDKVLTVFKSHPVHPEGGLYTYPQLFDWAEKIGFRNDYTIFLEDGNMNDLVSKSGSVISHSSTLNLLGALHGKPVMTFKRNQFFEFTKLVSGFDDLESDIPDINKVKHFLSWFYHCLTIDTDNPYFTTKIDHILSQIKRGHSFRDIFSYDTQTTLAAYNNG